MGSWASRGRRGHRSGECPGATVQGTTSWGCHSRKAVSPVLGPESDTSMWAASGPSRSWERESVPGCSAAPGSLGLYVCPPVSTPPSLCVCLSLGPHSPFLKDSGHHEGPLE